MSLSLSAGAVPPASAATPAMSPRTRLLLHGAILPTLLRLAWPNILVMLAQASTGLIDWWVCASAPTRWPAWRWSFPCSCMMQMLSGGAMGGGIS